MYAGDEVYDDDVTSGSERIYESPSIYEAMGLSHPDRRHRPDAQDPFCSVCRNLGREGDDR